MPLSQEQLKQIILSTTIQSLPSTKQILYGNIVETENEKTIILAIKSLLSNAKTRTAGLELVKDLIVYCTFDILVENAIFWASNCTVHHTQDVTKELKLTTLAKIIEHTANVDSFNKKFLAEYLSDTLKACLSYHSHAEKIASLKCLSQCMKRYPSWFGNHKPKVELFLVTFMENAGSSVKDAAIGFHLLHQTGGAGVDGINYINNFRCQFKKLCATVHNLYDVFLESSQEMYNSEKIDGEVFQFSQLPPTSSSQKILEATGCRIINCLIFIKIMIAKKFPVEKQIIPKHVVDIVNRGLSVHICMSTENISTETNSQSLLLNKIQLELLKLLRVFMIGYLSSVLPFSYVLTKSLLNTLKRTDNCMCFMTDLTYKKSAYKTLINWLSLTKSINQLQLQESLLPMLLKDISPVKKTISLKLNRTGKSKSGKKSIPTAQNNTLDKTPCIIGNSLKEMNCICALEVLECLFSTCSLSNNQPLLKELILVVVKTLGDIQADRVVPPYDNMTCQVKLYGVLISFFKHEPSHIIPPIHLVIAVFNRGLNSGNYKISQTCNEGLELLEKISHPVCSSLYICESKPELNKHSLINSIEVEEVACEELDDASIEENSQIHVENSKTIDQINENNSRGKEIHILSNILISQSKDATPNANTIEDNNFTDKLESETIEVEITDLSIDDKTQSLSDNVILASDEITGNHIREPPIMKREDSKISLDEMLNSFQDVIKESETIKNEITDLSIEGKSQFLLHKITENHSEEPPIKKKKD